MGCLGGRLGGPGRLAAHVGLPCSSPSASQAASQARWGVCPVLEAAEVVVAGNTAVGMLVRRRARRVRSGIDLVVEAAEAGLDLDWVCPRRRVWVVGLEGSTSSRLAGVGASAGRSVRESGRRTFCLSVRLGVPLRLRDVVE